MSHRLTVGTASNTASECAGPAGEHIIHLEGATPGLSTKNDIRVKTFNVFVYLQDRIDVLRVKVTVLVGEQPVCDGDVKGCCM